MGHVAGIVSASGLHFRSLKLEITEIFAVAEPERTCQMLEELCARRRVRRSVPADETERLLAADPRW